MKECPKCKQQKPEISFGKRVSSALSTKKYSQSWCSECRKEAVYKGRGALTFKPNYDYAPELEPRNPLPEFNDDKVWNRRKIRPRQFEVTLPVDPKHVTAAFAPPPIPTDRNELKALYHRLTNDQQSRSANRMTERLLGRWKRGERW